ncbi:MAG: aspartate--tRNA ligase [Oligoflexales bacterium]|nr:aspartate--tRNA ligase [Oligoflexales bacterium]
MNQLGLLEWQRTHNCGELNASHANTTVTLMGWVHKRRDHGQVIFIDLRDRFGLTQVVLDTAQSKDLLSVGEQLRQEFVIAVRGKVRLRPEGMINKDLSTGILEVIVEEMQLLNKSETLPFQISEGADASDSLRLKYRYLDLRRPKQKQILLDRIRFVRCMRRALEAENFLEIETPYLYKSTPEGAREFLVPSRVHPGQFYALPQSPQLFKQVLMISGFDRYYQLVKCFRDEDLRADRQPEFTQLDCEMSFVNQQMLMSVFERVVQNAFNEYGLKQVAFPLPRMTFDVAMENYGNDKPDLRFDLKLQNLSSIVAKTEFRVFREALDLGGIVNAIVVSGQAENLSRKAIDEITEVAKQHGAKGLAWLKMTEEGGAQTWQSPIAKFFDAKAQSEINSALKLKVGDLVFFGAGPYETTKAYLSEVRLELGRRLKLMKTDEFKLLWITDFPLLEKVPQTGRFVARHHPFTMPLPEDIPLLNREPEKVRAAAYDLVLNGNEVAGGSIRIHNQELQKQLFSTIGLTDQEARDKFGFLLDALQFGAPPHGGMAFGVDRLAMIITGCDAIRDVIAFPKTQKATCLMTESPSPASADALRELHIKVRGSADIG